MEMKNKFNGTSKDGKFNKFLEKRLIPIFGKISSWSIIVTVRDVFALLLPLIIAGSIALLGSSFIFGWGANEPSKELSTSIIGWLAWLCNAVDIIDGENGAKLWSLQGKWVDVANIGNHLFSFMCSVIFDYFALYLSVFIAWRWATIHNSDNAIMAGAIGLVSFLIVSQCDPNFFGPSGLALAMFIGFVSSQLFIFFNQCKKIKFKFKKQSIKSIADELNLLITIVLVLLIIACINTISYCIGYYGNLEVKKGTDTIIKPGEYGFAGLFFKFISSPFKLFIAKKEAGLGIAILYTIFNSIFWWIGIHGSSVLDGFFMPVLLDLVVENFKMIANLKIDKFDSSLSVVNWAFLETYIMTTGVGVTGGLIIATSIFSRKNRRIQQINKVAIPAAIFNINEPVTFGYPLILDPVLGIPFIFAMTVFTIYVWLFVGPFELVAKSYIYVPWTMPIGLGAFFSTGFDWRALLLSLSVLPLSFLYYLPFVLIKNKVDIKLEQKQNDDNAQPQLADNIFSEFKQQSDK